MEKNKANNVNVEARGEVISLSRKSSRAVLEDVVYGQRPNEEPACSAGGVDKGGHCVFLKGRGHVASESAEGLGKGPRVPSAR